MTEVDELIKSLSEKMDAKLASNPDKPGVAFTEIPYVRRAKRSVKSCAGKFIHKMQYYVPTQPPQRLYPGRRFQFWIIHLRKLGPEC
jgi:hypothetical protein